MIMSSSSLLDFLLSSCLVTLAMATQAPLPPTAESPTSNLNNSSPCTHHDHFSHPNQYLNINAVIIAAMLCAFLCALGLNSMLHCVLRGTQRILREPVEWAASRRLNSGLKKKDVVALPTSTYTDSTGYSSSRSPAPSDSVSSYACAICLVDFCGGDKIRVLPECHHRFHVACIDEWLLSHSSCPTCRHQLKSINCVSLPCLHIVTAF